MDLSGASRSDPRACAASASCMLTGASLGALAASGTKTKENGEREMGGGIKKIARCKIRRRKVLYKKFKRLLTWVHGSPYVQTSLRISSPARNNAEKRLIAKSGNSVLATVPILDRESPPSQTHTPSTHRPHGASVEAGIARQPFPFPSPSPSLSPSPSGGSSSTRRRRKDGLARRFPDSLDTRRSPSNVSDRLAPLLPAHYSFRHGRHSSEGPRDDIRNCESPEKGSSSIDLPCLTKE